MGAGQLASEGPQTLKRERVVIACPHASQSCLHSGPVALGEVIEDIAFLVADTALHWDGAENLIDGRSERLAAVEDDEDALLDGQSPGDEICEEVRGDSLVLRRAVPQSQRELHAVGADTQRDNAAAALQLDPVDHQR